MITLANGAYYERRNEEGLVREPHSLSSPQGNTSDLYAQFFQNKLASFRGQIEEIDIELEARQSIHRHLVKEIDYQVLSASIFLDQIKHWAIGYKVGVDMERNFWEKRIADLTKEKRMELLRLWRDSSSLKEDRRELLREHEELLKRRNLLR